MVAIKPFKALRPRNDLAEKLSELPYDVVNAAEAREIARDNPYSFFHVTKPQIDLDNHGTSNAEEAYLSGKRMLDRGR